MAKSELRILQFAHGKIYPSYSSAYAVRCNKIFEGKDRKLISVGGLVFSDYLSQEIEQYRSILLSGISYIKGNRYFEIGLSTSKFLREAFKKRIRSLIRDFDILVFEGPWIFPLLEGFIDSGKIVVYDAHNVEGRLRSGNKYEAESISIERRLVNRADLIFAMSKGESDDFQHDYAADPSRIHILPLLADRKPYGWAGSKTKNVVFIGAIYDPNIKALQRIGQFANELPDFTFHVVGSVSNSSQRAKVENIVYHGVVDEQTKQRIFNESLVALNPVEYGGGRNLKIVDYMSQGVPVITTPVGFRGLDISDWNGLISIKEIDAFPGAIREMEARSGELHELSRRIYDSYQSLLDKEGREDAYKTLLDRFGASISTEEAQ